MPVWLWQPVLFLINYRALSYHIPGIIYGSSHFFVASDFGRLDLWWVQGPPYISYVFLYFFLFLFELAVFVICGFCSLSLCCQVRFAVFGARQILSTIAFPVLWLWPHAVVLVAYYSVFNPFYVMVCRVQFIFSVKKGEYHWISWCIETMRQDSAE